MKPRVGILALGAANRASIARALERAGASVEFVESVARLRACDAIVFPGVAHFGYVADELVRRGLREPLVAAIEAGMPYFGICVGFQMLFEGSDEAPDARGLRVFSERIERLRGPKSPHMGWNTVEPLQPAQNDRADWAYFAHEYAPPAAIESASAITNYGSAFASVAKKGNVSGVQFHPERSGEFGTRFLSHFVESARLVRAR